MLNVLLITIWNTQDCPDNGKWIFNTSRPIQNFQTNFLRKVQMFIQISLEVLEEVNYLQISIGSDNGLLPIRRQTIIWTNVGFLLTHICVTLPQWGKTVLVCSVLSQSFTGDLNSTRLKLIWFSFNIKCFTPSNICDRCRVTYLCVSKLSHNPGS